MSGCNIKLEQNKEESRSSSGDKHCGDQDSNRGKIHKEDLLNAREDLITEYDARSDGCPVENTEAINYAIQAAARAGGGTVVVPEGSFKTYTVLLQDHAHSYFVNSLLYGADIFDVMI